MYHTPINEGNPCMKKITQLLNTFWNKVPGEKQGEKNPQKQTNPQTTTNKKKNKNPKQLNNTKKSPMGMCPISNELIFYGHIYGHKISAANQCKTKHVCQVAVPLCERPGVLFLPFPLSLLIHTSSCVSVWRQAFQIGFSREKKLSLILEINFQNQASIT